MVDKDRIDGSINQATGSIKETVGKLTGDAKLKTEGSTQKLTGTIQNAVGGLKDTIKENLGASHDKQ